MYTVQSTTPLPARRTVTAERVRKYPFAELEVGDMFFVPHKARRSLASHAAHMAKQLQIRLSVRQVIMRQVQGTWHLCDTSDAGATHGVGVWRVA